MTSLINLKENVTWNLNKSSYDEIDELPLMATPGPVCAIAAMYLIFVLKIGPEYMKTKKPYLLTGTLIVYNAIQVLLSVYLVQRFARNLLTMGLISKKCHMNDYNYRRELLFGFWLYFFAKVTELLDTVLFVFRKKDNQITFLHLYHHTCMVVATWALIKYWPSETLVFIGFLNSLVHVFMYTYYGLSAFGPKLSKYLTWKKYITKFQLVQFVSIIIQYIASVIVSDCPPSKGIATFISCNTVFFLFLFANFYRKSYKAAKSKEDSNEISNKLNNAVINEVVKKFDLNLCAKVE